MRDRDILIEQSTTLIEQSPVHFLLKAECNYLIRLQKHSEIIY